MNNNKSHEASNYDTQYNSSEQLLSNKNELSNLNRPILNLKSKDTRASDESWWCDMLWDQWLSTLDYEWLEQGDNTIAASDYRNLLTRVLAVSDCAL